MPDVAVLGGGFAGLSAATALAAAGARVLVLEARPTLGGRAGSFRDPETGEVVDNGQHVLVGCYHETMAFLARIGATGALHRQACLSVAMIDRAGHPVRLELPPLAPPWHLISAVLGWRVLGLGERLALGGVALDIRRAHRDVLAGRPVAAEHAQETVRAWLVRRGQSPRITELLWEPLAIAALNQPIDRAAAAPFIAVLARMFGGEASDAALVLPAVPLTDLYALPARRWLEAQGSEVRTRAAGRIVVEHDRVRGVRVGGDLIAVPTVVAAVPWHALEAAFESPVGALAGTVDAARATPGEPIVTVNLWLERPLEVPPVVGLPGRTFQWVFDRRALVGEEVSHLSLVASGADAVVGMTNDQLVERALRDLGTAVPGVEPGLVRRASAVRERRATFSLTPGLPPRPAGATAVDGLYLAGDWIATGLPATIESAVVSGHRAADLVSGDSPGH